MPRFDKIISACSFSSGSTRAATFELLIAMLTPPFFAFIIEFCISDCKTVYLNTESSSWIMPLILSATICASSSSFRALYPLTVIYTSPRLVVRVVPPPARAACGKFQSEPSKCGRVSSGRLKELMPSMPCCTFAAIDLIWLIRLRFTFLDAAGKQLHEVRHNASYPYISISL